MRQMKIAGALLIAILALGGCASSKSGGVYSRDQARQTQEVQLGVVDSVREVQLEGTKSPVGAAAGAVIGGVAGSNVGSGKGSTIGTVLGAVAGGLLGSMAEEGITRKPGLEITVKLDGGRLIAVTQEADEKFRPGDRVRVLTGGGVTRVSH